MHSAAMLRRVWKPFTAVVVLAGPAGYYYYSRRRRKDLKKSQWPILSSEEVNQRLTENATYQRVPRPEGIVWNYTTASLASNNPIEDAYANQIIERDATDPAAPGDLLFFAVMDGHRGPNTAQLLARELIPTVVSELALLSKKSYSPELNHVKAFASMIKKMEGVPLHANPSFINLAILSAFEKLDHSIITAPFKLLSKAKPGMKLHDSTPDFSHHPLALEVIRPMLSGSCALLAVFDTAHRGLHIACTGDSRAVAGVWEEGTDGEGHWRAYDLSMDLHCNNRYEIDRIRSEHPRDELYDVLVNGRLLGRLQPSRAFGDASYKLDVRTQQNLHRVFLKNKGIPMQRIPTNLWTPPYLTAIPDVQHYELDFLPLAGRPKSSLRFIVLGTDGLWDELRSREVVALVAGHLQGVRGTLPTSGLPKTLVPGEDSANFKSSSENVNRSWAFVDDNVSTHVIRNAFGGADEDKLRQLLSIPAPLSRKYRDDIMVTVIWWEDGREGADDAVSDDRVPQREYTGFHSPSCIRLRLDDPPQK